jgi:Tfp pilus assembly protein PilO
VPPRISRKKHWAVDRQQLIILLVGAVMLVSFFLLVLWPKQRELADLDRDVKQERGVVSQKVLASHEGVYVSARIPTLRRALDRLGRQLPSEPKAAEFLQQAAELLAEEAEVTHEVARMADEPVGPASAIPIRLRLQGPFEAVYRCLGSLEGLERLARFRRVSFNRQTDGTVRAEAEWLIYYVPDAPPAAAAGREPGAKVRG